MDFSDIVKSICQFLQTLFLICEAANVVAAVGRMKLQVKREEER